VRYDKDLINGAKLLYGEITALCNQEGYCWAGNSYFAELYSVTNRTISNWINTLESKGYITRKVIRDEEGKVDKRLIYLSTGRNLHEGIEENFMPPRKNLHEGIEENFRSNITSINTTSNNTSNKRDSRIRDIYNHYLSKNIVKHQKMTSSMRTAIRARLRDYTYEQLIQAINNYAVVYHSNDFWFDTKYTLTDLMRDKDVRKFIDDADPLTNFKKRGASDGVRGYRNSNARGSKAGTSYERAIQEVETARRAFNR